MKSMRVAADDIEKQTEGRVKFKFYPGGVMGSDEAVLRKIRIGQLQGGAMPGGALVSFYPDAQVYNLPLKFRSFAEVDYVRARMDQKIVDGLEEGGFVTFGLGEGGFAYILSKDAISTMEDLRAHKVWIPNNDAGALLAIKTFGVSPIPLNLSDVLAGLQTGLVDTVASSPIGTIALQWHTQVSHMSDLPVMYFYALLAIDKKPFGKLSPADQAVVRKTMTEAFDKIDKQNRIDNVAAYDALLKQGINQVEMSASQREPWYAAASEAEKNMVDQGVISSAILRELDGYLQEVREQTGATP
jgi:TRAP-type C4-dicarboxylate transport system substrate-binding protein